MPRPMNRSQMQAKLRQAQANQRQAAQKFNSAVRKYNNEVRDHNSRVNSAINNDNREVRTYNSRVRANRTRLRSTLNRLSHQTVTVRYSVVHSSVLELASAYERLDASNSDPFLSDLAERETANSAQVLTSLLDDSGDPLEAATDLTNTTITDSLVRISPDLNTRWSGALFALHPNNPDAARHFCTSSREIITTILDIEAPNEELLHRVPHCQLTQQGTPTRRAKLQFLLQRQGTADEALESFAEANIADVLSLFPLLNDGTHGPAGAYSITQLYTIKNRVQGAIEFICEIARHQPATT